MSEKTVFDAENGAVKRGGISVETEHIFPIIKKWLYSEKEIFLREIVSNAADAVTKLRRLISLGEVRDIPDGEDDFRIDVILDAKAGTLTVRDNGIGMTADELQKYICNIALSGALDFIEKYEGESGGGGIIGHFGLGFYSAFMVSDTVEVISKSYSGEKAVKWVCDDSGNYEMSEPDEEPERGTSVIMHINEEEKEFLSPTRVRDILEKYCAFLPVKIYFKDVEKEESESKKDNGGDTEATEAKAEEPINDIHPLWQKNASDCTEDEYKEFYHRVFHDYRDPLFWIHISADYPLNFRGILYFPKLINEYESLEGQIKLYYNQVFVADNIKEVIPEYLLMLRGVLDCPELPLNVSRSYLQNNGYVTKMSQHIVKKVADKLNSLYNTEREKYEKIWDNIKTFVEYGCLRDSKFYGRIKGSVLLPLTDGRHVTIDEYLEKAKEKHKDKIYYASDKTAQAQYIAVYEKEGIDVAYLDTVIDSQFITLVEHDKNIKFLRVDAEIADVLKGDDSDKENKADDEKDKAARDRVTELFRRIAGDDKLTVKFESLRDAGLPAVITEPEHTRRIDDMMKLYGIATSGANYKQNREVMITLNTNNALINRICSTPENETSEKIARHIWSLARLTRGSLTPDEMGAFLTESYDILGLIP